MPKTKSVDIPSIEELKLSELVIDLRFSGRTEKEIKANSKELAPVMEAHGSWDAGQPGQYFEQDGKKILCAGFTRMEAAKSAGFKVGYFTRSDESKSALLLKCFTTNQGKPISAWKQGERFAQLRDGEKPEDAAVGQDVLAPMPIKEISALIGKSDQHVANCIAVFEAPEEIGNLIIEGKLSANVFNRVRQIAKTTGKQMEIIRAAAKVAKEEDKECVTMKHFDAVKAQFVEPKKLKAAATQPDLPTSAPGSTPVAAKPEADTNTTEDEPEAVVEDNAKPVKVPHVAPVQSLADLGADAETVNKKKLEKYRKQIIEAIAGWDAGPDPDKDAQVAFEDSQIESLADAICKVAQPF